MAAACLQLVVVIIINFTHSKLPPGLQLKSK